MKELHGIAAVGERGDYTGVALAREHTDGRRACFCFQSIGRNNGRQVIAGV